MLHVSKGEQARQETYVQPSYEPVLLAAALRLSLQQGSLLCYLLSNSISTLQGIEKHTGLSPESRRTMICRLRARLGENNAHIQSHPGLGYSISSADRRRIDVAVDRFRGLA